MKKNVSGKISAFALVATMSLGGVSAFANTHDASHSIESEIGQHKIAQKMNSEGTPIIGHRAIAVRASLDLNLTEEQKNEIGQLREERHKLQSALVEKQHEFGLIGEEEFNIFQNMDSVKIGENGEIPKFAPRLATRISEDGEEAIGKFKLKNGEHKAEILSIRKDENGEFIVKDHNGGEVSEYRISELPEGMMEHRRAAIAALPADMERPEHMKVIHRGMAETAEDMQAKIDGLTSEQKRELIELSKDVIAVDIKILEKSFEFGMIEAEAYQSMKANLEEMHDGDELGMLSFHRTKIVRSAE